MACPECNRLTAELNEAIANLANTTARLVDIAGTGKHDSFDALLAVSKEAKDECERIRAERDQHQATHLPWLYRKDLKLSE
jgi:hypothetical protein